MSYFNRKRAQDDEPEVIVIEKIETRQLPVALWPRRVCIFCHSERIRIYGKTRDKKRRYVKCDVCRQEFVAQFY